MKGFQRRVVLLTLVALVLALPGLALAQQSKIEIAVGYAWEDDEGFKYPVGWTGSAVAYLTSWLGLVGEADGNYHRDHVPDQPEYTYRGQAYTVNTHTFAGGLRGRKMFSPVVSGFGQVLFGSHRIAGVPIEPFGWSQWSFLAQPGGGVSINVSRLADVRFSVDVPLVRVETFTDQGDSFIFGHEFRRMTRIGVGFALGFGERR
jgi:hypothetical protein